MLKDLIQEDPFIAGAVALMILVTVSAFFCLYKNQKAWEAAPTFSVTCNLLNLEFHPPTKETHMAPVLGGKSVSFAVYSTGSSEKSVSVWDCGERLGRISTENEEVFRWAKPVSELMFAQRGDEIRLRGIKR